MKTERLNQPVRRNKARFPAKPRPNKRFVTLGQKIDSNRVLLEQRLELLRSSMTSRLGSMLVVAMGLLFAALRLSGS